MATQVMGILNVTEDSFAESTPLVVEGAANLDAALARAHDMVACGADIIDVGGESTRPGALRVAPEIEMARVVPVVRALVADGIVVSVDTTRAAVARACLDAGATLINDVSGATADPEMLAVLANSQCRCILMHRRGDSADMYAHAEYDDVVAEVIRELAQRVDAAVTAGISTDRIILDPGLGFAKQPEHNWDVLAHLPALMSLGFPLLIGASRKRFLGELLSGADSEPRSTDGRDTATAVLSALCAREHVWGVRVHDVQGSRDAIAVVERLQESQPQGGRHGDLLSDRHEKAQGAGGPLITLTGVHAFGRHGVFEFEREQGQTFIADVRMKLERELQSDTLTQTVDYSSVAADIENIISGEPVDLIETLADRICLTLIERYPCTYVHTTVHKPQAPMSIQFADVSVTVERAR